MFFNAICLRRDQHIGTIVFETKKADIAYNMIRKYNESPLRNKYDDCFIDVLFGKRYKIIYSEYAPFYDVTEKEFIDILNNKISIDNKIMTFEEFSNKVLLDIINKKQGEK